MKNIDTLAMQQELLSLNGSRKKKKSNHFEMNRLHFTYNCNTQ